MKGSSKTFWKWFEKNNAAYFFLNDVEPKVKEKLLSDFLKELHKYCDNLFFEIGNSPDDEYEIIITAEGNPEFFPQVEKLVEAAPLLPKWTYTAFIPPRDIHFQINYEGLVLNPEEMWFMPLENESDKSSIGISICIMNYEIVKDHEFFNSAMYKIIDVLLGEKSAALDLDYLSFDQLPDNPEEEGFIELAELPDYISWKKNQHTQ